ncbi:MAG TPA: RsmB/NOP family class I SAM-dependent RNA methyltransferase [Sedimenticola sp.]|nr:RsmB/NOP family class I SAM-dependent RNA methyltransferase [Sedimenticola sp.]
MSRPRLPFPEPFLERLQAIVPAGRLPAVLESFTHRRPTTFRGNPLKRDDRALEEELAMAGFRLDPVPWLPGAWRIPPSQRRALTESTACLEGRLYIQGLSSMLAPILLAPRPGEQVLDLAAAPGGKTLQMAAMMANRGRLSAVEPVRSRFFRLRANLERHGATMVKAYRMDGRAVGSKVPERFDRVLLDAPCSSEARFRAQRPESWAYWSLRKIRECAHKQRRLLESGLRALRPGGTLLYCTCSFAPEENEAVVDAALARHPGELEVEPLGLELEDLQPGLDHWQGRAFDPALAAAVRVLPGADREGLFLCRLRRRSVPGHSVSPSSPSRKTTR